MKIRQNNSWVGHPNMCFHLSKLFDAFVFAAFQAYAALWRLLHLDTTAIRGRSLATLTKFCPILTTYLPPFDIGQELSLLLYKKFCLRWKFSNKVHIMQLDHIRFAKSSFCFWPIIRFSVFPAQFWIFSKWCLVLSLGTLFTEIRQILAKFIFF